MTRRLLTLAGLLVLFLSPMRDAHAQFMLGASTSCADTCLTLAGAHFSTGLAAWPSAYGLALSGGVFYDSPFGADFALWMPLSGTASIAPLPFMAVLGRWTMWRESFGVSGLRPSAPPVSLAFHLRAGLALSIREEPSAGFALGPSAELLLGGLVIVALRPLLMVVPDSSAPRGALPLHPLPILELSIGIASTRTCGMTQCVH